MSTDCDLFLFNMVHCPVNLKMPRQLNAIILSFDDTLLRGTCPKVTVYMLDVILTQLNVKNSFRWNFIDYYQEIDTNEQN